MKLNRPSRCISEKANSADFVDLVKLMPLKTKQNLLYEEQKQSINVPHLLRNVTISLVSEDKLVPIGSQSLPYCMNKHIKYWKNKDKMTYFPIVFFNEFWEMNEQFSPIENQETMEMTLHFQPISFLKFQVVTHMDESFKQQKGSGSEFDDIKVKVGNLQRMLSETSPILILITFLVSLLHSIFDFFAFKNDIQFWRNRTDLEGLSVRSIMINSVSQLIVFLYLLDQETSWLVLVSVFLGFLIELYKLKQAVSITFEWKRLGFIRFKDKSSYISKTKEYDEMAIRYLGYVALPLLVGYTAYSLIYNEHKGWYSFVVGTLVGYVYAFGFIMMTPQLFINYKLKSVAHMPWKAFMYKALNTFVDDLFAFVIKMPWLHRLACFRDDILFLVYLYQRWIYPVDKKRLNEFGQKFKEDEGEKEAKESNSGLLNKPKTE